MKKFQVKSLIQGNNLISTNVNLFFYFLEVCKTLDTLLNDPRQSRLFAIIAVGGNQFKVTTEDTILIRNHFYPSIGDKIRLEKVIFYLICLKF